MVTGYNDLPPAWAWDLFGDLATAAVVILVVGGVGLVVVTIAAWSVWRR